MVATNDGNNSDHYQMNARAKRLEVGNKWLPLICSNSDQHQINIFKQKLRIRNFVLKHTVDFSSN